MTALLPQVDEEEMLGLMDSADALPAEDAVSAQLAGAASRFLAHAPAAAGDAPALTARLAASLLARLDCGAGAPAAQADAMVRSQLGNSTASVSNYWAL